MADAWVYGWIGRKKDRKENGEVYAYMDIGWKVGWVNIAIFSYNEMCNGLVKFLSGEHQNEHISISPQPSLCLFSKIYTEAW